MIVNGHTLVLDTSVRVGDDQPHTARTANSVWNCSVVLLKYFEKYMSHCAPPSSVLELGAGTGVLGIGAACCLPPSAAVYLTDIAMAMPALEVDINILVLVS